MFELEWTDEASSVYNSLKGDSSQKTHYKAVKKAIKLLAQNPRYKSLQTHEFKSLSGPNGERKAEEDISAGRLHKFDSAGEAVDFLHRRAGDTSSKAAERTE